MGGGDSGVWQWVTEVCKGVGKGGGGGAEAPSAFKLMYYVNKQLPQKRHPKFRKAREEKAAFRL